MSYIPYSKQFLIEQLKGYGVDENWPLHALAELYVRVKLGAEPTKIGPNDDIQSILDSLAEAYAQTGLTQVAVADPAVIPPADLSVPKGVKLVVGDNTDYGENWGWRDREPWSSIILPYPAAVIYRVDDPAQTGGGSTNWWTSTNATLQDPMFGNAASTPLDYARRRGIIFSFGQVSSRIGTVGSYTYFSKAELKRIVHYGSEICSHSVTHGHPQTQEEEQYEVAMSRKQLEDALADPTTLPSWSVSGQCALSAISLPPADRVLSFIIPGDWDDSQTQLVTQVEGELVNRSQRTDWLMRANYEVIQRCEAGSPGLPGLYNRAYRDWDKALDPAASWDSDVAKLLGRTKTYPTIVTVAHHGPTVNQGTTSVPTAAQFKTLVDTIYDYMKQGWCCCVPLRSAPRLILTPSPYGHDKPDFFRGGLCHGLFDISNVSDTGTEAGITVTASGNGAAAFESGSSFWKPWPHDYTAGYVLKLYWTGTTSGSAYVKWLVRVPPCSRCVLRFDFVAPSSGNGHKFWITIGQYRDYQGDTWSRIVEEWMSPTATDDWQTIFIPMFIYPQATHLNIQIAADYTNRVTNKGVALSNVQFYQVA